MNFVLEKGSAAEPEKEMVPVTTEEVQDGLPGPHGGKNRGDEGGNGQLRQA